MKIYHILLGLSSSILLAACSSVPQFVNSTAKDAAEISTRSDSLSKAIFGGGVFTAIESVDGAPIEQALQGRKIYRVTPGHHVIAIRSPGPGYNESKGLVSLDVRPNQQLVFRAVFGTHGTVVDVIDVTGGKETLVKQTQLISSPGTIPTTFYIPSSVYSGNAAR